MKHAGRAATLICAALTLAGCSGHEPKDPDDVGVSIDALKRRGSRAKQPAPPPSTPPAPLPPPPPPEPQTCVTSGCSSEVCAESPVFTTCRWRPEYECRRLAKCERQEDGFCGWTATPESLACLASLPPEETPEQPAVPEPE